MRAIHIDNAIIGGIRVKAKNQGLSFSISTGEVPDEQKVEFMHLQDVIVDLLIQPKDTEFPDIVEVKSEVDQKTPSSRLRGVLYILFSQKPEGHTTFASYYDHKMSGIIDHLKGKIED